MMAGHKNTYDCIAAFSATDFSKDLARFDKPTIVIHGDDDQVVPIEASARAVKRRLPSAQLIEYKGAPHGITDTHKERLNKDLLAFVKS
jgi:non-heme chloroperoxidase